MKPFAIPVLLLSSLALSCGDDANPTPVQTLPEAGPPDASSDSQPPDSAPDTTPPDAAVDVLDSASDPDADAASANPGWLAVVGGGAEGDIGDDQAWSADVYGWIVDKAQHGRVAILAADPQTDFLSSYFEWLGASEAEDVTIGTPSDAADPQKIAALASADAIFIKGGDQSRYLDAWQGSEVLDTLASAYERGKVLAGTSAGAHVLGGIIYDARNGSVYLDEAVRDPWDPHITFSPGFVEALPSVVLDTHFTERGRLARLAPMFARLLVDDAATELAIGLDDRTGLLVDPQGIGEVRGEGAVTFLRPKTETEISAAPGAPASVSRLGMDVLGDGYRIDVGTGEILARPSEFEVVSVAAVQKPSAIQVVDGSDLLAKAKGSVTVSGATPYALVDGELAIEPAEGAVPGFVIETRSYASSQMDTIENRMGGVQWVLRSMGTTVPFALVMDDDSSVAVDTSGAVTAQPSSDPSSVLLLDGRSLVEAGTSPHAPRQSVSLVGLELHLLAPGQTWLAP